MYDPRVSEGLLEFRNLRLDVAGERLWRGERSGKLVKNEELLDAVWEGAAVTAGTLNTSIRELRKTLGGDARQPSYIETAHRCYMLLALW